MKKKLIIIIVAVLSLLILKMKNFANTSCEKYSNDSIFFSYIEQYWQHLKLNKNFDTSEKQVFVITIDNLDKESDICNFSISYIFMDYELPFVDATHYCIYKNRLILFRNKKKFLLESFPYIKRIESDDYKIINLYIIQKGEILGMTYRAKYLIVRCNQGNCHTELTFLPEIGFECKD